MTDHQGAVERLTDALGAWDTFDPDITRGQIVMQANDLAKASRSILTAYQAAEALEGAALKYKLAVLAFEAFEAENPNDSGRRWEAVFEARNIAQDALFALLPSPGGEGA